MANCFSCNGHIEPKWKVCPECGVEIPRTHPVSSVNVQDGVISGDVTINNLMQSTTEKSSCRICLKYGQFTIFTCFSCHQHQCETCTIIDQSGNICSICSTKKYQMQQQNLAKLQEEQMKLQKERQNKDIGILLLIFAGFAVTYLAAWIYFF
jgi:hypothetical protein